MATIIFDIETGPLPEPLLSLIKPTFMPARNLKDAEKIKADIQEKEANWRERAALAALTGQVLAIGLLSVGPRIILGDEREMVALFWAEWAKGDKFVGFSVKHFDMPFLFQRSLILGVRPPTDLFEGRYWNNRIVDLQERWCCYSNRTDGQSLGAVCRACGLGDKTGDGANFAALLKENPAAAQRYLANDLELTAKLAKRLGVQ